MVWISKISPASIGGLIYTVVKQGVTIAVWICACLTGGLIYMAGGDDLTIYMTGLMIRNHGGW